MAGDIASGISAVPWIQEYAGDTPVVYIAGNHEFYRNKIPSLYTQLQVATQGTNIYFLQDSSVRIMDWTIYGATLWTDFALYGDPVTGMLDAQMGMNDYKLIRNSAKNYRRLVAADTLHFHRQSMLRLSGFFDESKPTKSIVVTHHAPSRLSLPAYKEGDHLNPAYASNLDDLVSKLSPALWIHGHVHCSNDYMIGNTRVISNPQGYSSEQPPHLNPTFDSNLIIELS
jgi:hypothetical protein